MASVASVMRLQTVRWKSAPARTECNQIPADSLLITGRAKLFAN